MADNNRGSELKNKLAKGAATVAGGPAAGKAVDLAQKAKLGLSSVNKNADLLAKQGNPALAKPSMSGGSKSVDDLPKEGLEEGEDYGATESAASKIKNKVTGNDDKSDMKDGSANSEKSIAKSFMKKHKFKIIGACAGLMGAVFIILIVIIAIESVGGSVKQFFTNMGDAIVGFFQKDEFDAQAAIEDYYEELDKVKKAIKTKKGVCIDENLITATLTVDLDGLHYTEQGEEEPKIQDENEYSSVVDDYKEMKKQVAILANMQIITKKYGNDKSLNYPNRGDRCKPEESGTETPVVTEENYQNFDTTPFGWIALFLNNGFGINEALISDDINLVSQHDKGGILAFFSRKTNDERNFEYHLYQPEAVLECTAGFDSNGNCKSAKVPVCHDILPEDEYELSIGELNTMEYSVYYWNLVNQFIPDFYEEYLPDDKESEEYAEAVKDIAEQVYLLYTDLGPGESCEEDYEGDLSCTYAYNSSGKNISGEGIDTTTYMNNVHVQLLSCNSVTPISSPMPLEEYIKGVVASEIRGSISMGNFEAIKAQAVMARNFVLLYPDVRDTMSDGSSTLLKIQNCTNKQTYVDPQIVEKEAGSAAYEEFLSALKEVEGQVLVDANGDLIKNKPGESYMYQKPEQEEWMANSADYRTMLMETYSNADNLSSDCHANGPVDGRGSGSKEGDIPTSDDACAGYKAQPFYWTNSYGSRHPFSTGQCTWHAYGRGRQILTENLGYTFDQATALMNSWLNGSSNGGQWYERAVQNQIFDYAKAINPSSNPRGLESQLRVGTFVSWTGGVHWDGCPTEGCGHIAVIESIERNPDGSIKSITTSNGGGGKTCFAKTYNSLESFWNDTGSKNGIDGFIYLNR